MSLEFLTNDLAKAIKQKPSVGLSQATVVSVDSGATITIGIPDGNGSISNISGVSYLDSFTPVVGRVVFYLNNGGAILVLGQIAK